MDGERQEPGSLDDQRDEGSELEESEAEGYTAAYRRPPGPAWERALLRHVLSLDTLNARTLVHNTAVWISLHQTVAPWLARI